jgi:hypothetical protein
VLVRAKRSFQTRASSNKNTQSERRWGDKNFRPLDIDSSKDAHAKTASCERRGSYLAVAHSHIIFDVRRLFFFSILMYSNARDDDKSKETFREL